MSALKFRNKFNFPNKELLHWFPGHMNKGMKQMQYKLKEVDCVLELHDARVPFTGRNPLFAKSLVGAKPHILVLNKKDLTPTNLNKRIRQQLRAEENVNHVIFTNAKNENCTGVKMLVPLIANVIKESERFNRTDQKDYNVMIIGVPNIGKSSLINQMRSHNMRIGHQLQVGAKAGVTKAMHMKMRISKNPSIFMLDTPGILEPSVGNIESALKLAAIQCMPDHLVGEEIIADYILYLLNKNENFSYVELMGLTGPSDDISKVLISGSIKFNNVRKVRNLDNTYRIVPNLTEAARTMIKAFRSGDLGKMFLDMDRLDAKYDSENTKAVESK